MPEVPIIHFLKPPWGAAKNLFKQININQMFDKIQINLMTKTRCSNNFLRGKLPRGHLPPRIIAPVENCHPEKLPPRRLPPDYCFRTITPKIIAFWQYPPWKFSPPPLKEDTRDIFFPRFRNRSTFINSCFLLVSFFVI